MSDRFLYVIFIDAPIDAIWKALTDGEFTKSYWAGRRIESDWTKGAPLHLYINDSSECEIFGEVLASEPPTRLAYTWARHGSQDAPSRVSFELQPVGESVRLTLTHEPLADADNARQGWPAVLSSLKSYLEAGKPLAATALYRRPCNDAA